MAPRNSIPQQELIRVENAYQLAKGVGKTTCEVFLSKVYPPNALATLAEKLATYFQVEILVVNQDPSVLRLEWSPPHPRRRKK